jgi:hypothetical protein
VLRRHTPVELLTPICSSLYHEASGYIGLENRSQCCVLDRFKVKTFNSFCFADKRAVILNGKPTSRLSELQTKTKSYARYFRTSYESVKWLTRRSTTGKLYSWSCLLFVVEKGIWNGAGLNDINNFPKAIWQQEKTQSHLHAITALKHLVLLEQTHNMMNNAGMA